MKYKLGEKHAQHNLYRIVALKNFGDIVAGDIGGWIESEKNLSQVGIAWVSGEAQVYGQAHVSGEARVYGRLKVDFNPITLSGLKYPITIFWQIGYIQAGCYLKTVKEWEKITEFKDQEFLVEWKDKILMLAKCVGIKSYED